MIRVAAMADVHFGADAVGTLRSHLANLSEQADLLLIAGDLTRTGAPDEAGLFLDELEGIEIPVFAVLGNHDYHADRSGEIAQLLQRRGVHALEGRGTTIEINGASVGIAGVKGFGGGFVGARAFAFGEPEMKAFVRHSKACAHQLETALSGLSCDLKLAIMHYAPVPETLHGERLELYPFLGSYLLARAVDRAGADLVVHGHAHAGSEQGTTPGGVHVRNVALPVIKRAYALYYIDGVGEPPIDAPQSEFAGWHHHVH